MDGKSRPFASNPFDTNLWTAFRRFEELPCLDATLALSLWLGLGFMLAIGMLGLVLAANLAQFDRLLSAGTPAALMTIPWLIAVTAFIGIKQYYYYYGGPGRKDGIFVNRLRQVNEGEKNLDALLSVQGGVLIASTFLPTFWFLMMAVYSMLVLLRCHVTLRRSAYVRRPGVPDDLTFIAATLEQSHNGLKVDHVLAGWVFSHAILLLLALAIWYWLRMAPSAVLFFALSLGYLLIHYFGLRPVSYKAGRWVLRFYS